MEAPSSTRLDLRAPLLYAAHTPPLPEWFSAGSSREQLLCFELDPVQSSSIEPVRGQFLGKLLFSAYAPEKNSESKLSPERETVQLPAGIYLFTQIHEALEKELCIDMAIEQHKDGLWEKNKLRNVLYVRFLCEDNRQVTQIFRPIFF